MKQSRFTLKMMLLATIGLLLLAACERPVPGSDPAEAEPTPATTLPTLPPPAPNTGGEEPAPGDSGEPTADPAYPGPGEESGGETDDTAQPGEGGAEEGAADGSSGDSGAGSDSNEADAGSSGDTQTPPSTPNSHTVQAGDTLYSIALQCGLTVQELAAANNITNVNALSVGDVLTIPAPGTVTDTEQGGGQDTPTSGEQVHIVAPGENLFRIGLRYGFTVSELASYNNIANPNSIAVGQEIRIPAR